VRAGRYVTVEAWKIPEIAYANQNRRLAANDVLGDPVQMVDRIAGTYLHVRQNVDAERVVHLVFAWR
jgi:hypothetical protein